MDKDKNYKVIKSDKLSEPWNTRYIVVDDQGNLLDDANGYGYKSISNAHAAYNYKSVSDEKKLKIYQHDKAVLDWIDQHKEFVDTVDDEAFYALKDGESFTTKDIKKILSTLNLNPPYSAYEIFMMLKKHKPRYEKEIKKKEKSH